MATSEDVLCGLCANHDITKRAVQWCPECEKGLCFDCLNFHKSSKASKHHEVISVKNFKKLPKSISIVHHCKEHDKLYQNYCHHESLCCPVCITTDHKTCNNLTVIDDIIKTAKSSLVLESIEESIEILKRNLQLLIKEKDSNLNKNKTVKKDFLEHLKTVREQINTHFDKLEQQIKQDILAAEKQIKEQTDRLSKELKEKLRAAEELQKNLVAVKEYASDLETCVGSMSLKTRIEEEEKYIKGLKENRQFKRITIKCTLDENILAYILSVKTFGSVSTYDIQSTIDLNIQGKKGAQITLGPTPRIPKSFNEISLTLKCKFEIPAGKELTVITGCGFKPNGEFMIIDCLNSRLLIFDENEKLKTTINLPRLRPTGVTSVDDKTICVSYYDGYRLDLINTETYEIIQTIQTTGMCSGVTSEHGTLYWYEQRKGIQMKKQSSGDITTLVKAADHCCWCYVSVYDGMIYQTNEQQVSCFKVDGQKMWEFEDKSILTRPTGIAVAEDSNVYVADHDKGIFVLAPDGKNCRLLLQKDDGIVNPRAVCYESINNLLLISNLNGPAILYSIS